MILSLFKLTSLAMYTDCIIVRHMYMLWKESVCVCVFGEGGTGPEVRQKESSDHVKDCQFWK